MMLRVVPTQLPFQAIEGGYLLPVELESRFEIVGRFGPVYFGCCENCASKASSTLADTFTSPCKGTQAQKRDGEGYDDLFHT